MKAIVGLQDILHDVIFTDSAENIKLDDDNFLDYTNY